MKFTDQARSALTAAQEEAQNLNHNYIATEHILMGLLRISDGMAARTIAKLGVELTNIRTAVQFMVGRGESIPTSSEIGLTPRAQRVIELPVDESHRLSHDHVGTEHLLLGLLREGEGVAADVLKSRGVSWEEVWLEIAGVPGQAALQGHTSNQSLRRTQTRNHLANSQFEKFTGRAGRVLTSAQREAHHLNHNYIGTEHILLGLLRINDGMAARTITNLGAKLTNIRTAVQFMVGRGESAPTSSEIGLTPRAQRVIELAVDGSRRLNHDHVGTEHLLLGLLREGEGVAAYVLKSQGVNLEEVWGRLRPPKYPAN